MNLEDRIEPLDRVHPQFAKDLVRLHPNILMIWHPLYRCWQLYETGRRSNWTAQRLVNLIINQHEEEQRTGEMSERERAYWWWFRGAPLLVGDLYDCPEPGEWLLTWLRDADVSPQENLRRIDEYNLAKQISRAKERHDLHRAVADAIRKPVLERMPHGISRTDMVKRLRAKHKEPEIRY